MAGAAYGAIASVGRAYNGLLRQSGRRFERPRTDRAARDRATEPCHWLCVDCGFLVPQGTVGYRRSPEQAEARPTTCSACGGTDFADLREDAVVEVLAELDEAATRGRTRWWERPVTWRPRIRPVVQLAELAFIVLLAMELVRWSLVPAAVVGWVVLGLGVLHLGHTIAASVTVTDPYDRSRPARWSLPAKPRGPISALVEGAARARGEHRLTAPLSGRPCLAYEVGLRFDDRVDDAPSTWQLLEQRSAALQVGEHPVVADVLTLHGRRQIVEVDAGRLTSFLRRRGLAVPPGTVPVLVETIVEEGQAVALRLHASGGTLEACGNFGRQHRPAQCHSTAVSPQVRASASAFGLVFSRSGFALLKSSAGGQQHHVVGQHAEQDLRALGDPSASS